MSTPKYNPRRVMKDTPAQTAVKLGIMFGGLIAVLVMVAWVTR